MAEKDITRINELLVSVYDDIGIIEDRSLKSGAFKDLSITEIHTIEAVGLKDEKSMSEIAEELEITVGTLTTAIDKLIRKGYVERNRSNTDRRIVYITLTKKGKLAYRMHERFHYLMVKNVINDLSEEESHILVVSLEKLNNYLKGVYTDIEKRADKKDE